MTEAEDTPFMRRAIAAAAKNLGQTAPNPVVGCVLVKDGQAQILGRGTRGAWMGLAGARAYEGGWLRGGCPARGPAHQPTGATSSPGS